IGVDELRDIPEAERSDSALLHGKDAGTRSGEPGLHADDGCRTLQPHEHCRQPLAAADLEDALAPQIDVAEEAARGPAIALEVAVPVFDEHGFERLTALRGRGYAFVHHPAGLERLPLH